MKNVIDDKLLQLRDEYNRNLPEKIAILEAQWQTLQHQYDPELFKSFHRTIHSLCGSAGLYGHEALSHECHLLSNYLKQILGQPSAEQINFVTKSLETVKSYI